MDKEQREIRKRLNEELGHVSFSGAEKVLQRTHPKTLRQRWEHWWNKDVSISLVPAGIGLFLLLSASVVPGLFENGQDIEMTREIIKIGGNYYWEDLYREMSRK